MWSSLGAASDQSGATHNGAAIEGGTAHASGSVTPPTANNVVVTYAAHTGGDWTYDAAFTQVDAAGAGVSGYFGYLLQSSATAQEANHSSVDSEFACLRISAFAGAAAGGSRPSGSRMSLTGVGRC